MRILVVEDSSAVQSFHKLALGMFKDLVLDTAMDGVAALRLLAEHRYDAVLLDINMPLMDGLKVLSSMRRAGGHQAATLVYTPRHASWLNQVEIWFSILSRRALKRASFPSIEALQQRLIDFIDYFNAVLAKPFRWTYAGKPLRAA